MEPLSRRCLRQNKPVISAWEQVLTVPKVSNLVRLVVEKGSQLSKAEINMDSRLSLKGYVRIVKELENSSRRIVQFVMDTRSMTLLKL